MMHASKAMEGRSILRGLTLCVKLCRERRAGVDLSPVLRHMERSSAVRSDERISRPEPGWLSFRGRTGSRLDGNGLSWKTGGPGARGGGEDPPPFSSTGPVVYRAVYPRGADYRRAESSQYCANL